MDNFESELKNDSQENPQDDQSKEELPETDGKNDDIAADNGFSRSERRQNVFFALQNAEKPSEASCKIVFPEDFFWPDRPLKKEVGKGKIILAVTLTAVAVLLLTMLGLSMTLGKGWLKNALSGKDKLIEFTLPLNDRPQPTDQELIREDGRYTVQGLVEQVSDSVVSIVTFSFDNQIMQGQGSGIIMSQDGYILTNAHVVNQKDLPEIKVVLKDKTEYNAVVIGKDTRSDIAVLKIEATGLKPAVFGRSDQAKLGEEIVVIGCPAGLEGSVSEGVISGLDRDIHMSENDARTRCIQIDAAVNPGNSGGALFNMWGQVIGITTSKLSSTEYYGIGFAIEINEARPIIEAIMEYGCVPGQVRIGVTFYEIDEETAPQLNTYPGLYVVELDPDCDISNSGIKPGDTITEMDGVKVRSKKDVDELLKDKKPGESIKVKYIQSDSDGSELSTEFKLMDDSKSLVPAE